MLKLIIDASATEADDLADLLTEQGAEAVSLEDGGNQPLFQEKLHETPLWNQTQIQALFSEKTDITKIISELIKIGFTQLNYRVESLVEENWVAKTQENFPVRCFANRLWIVPSGAVLRINPGLGFGTGAHPTTALCLEWLAQQELTGKTIIDYGCGSGILGLSGLALGAEKVWAVDHDPQALTATRNNTELNHFPENAVAMVLPEQLPNLQAEIVLANILANPICELAPILISHLAPGGCLVLSGFLKNELEKVLAAYQPKLNLVATFCQDDWVMVILNGK